MPESDKSLWHALLEGRVSRRSAIKGGLAAAGATVLPLNLRVASATSESSSPTPRARKAGTTAAQLQPPFEPIQPTTADDLVLPRGYRYNALRIYGDEIAPGQPFGYNADFTAYFPIDGLEGGQSSTDGLLWVNHEYNNALLQHGNTGPKTPEQIRIERTSVGGSIFRVQRQRDGGWAFAQDSHNRRVTGYTTCRLTGPAAGTPGVRGATEVSGSVGNCSGGVTPWGTVLSCEENVDEYGEPVTVPFGSGWDATYVRQHNGWVMEVDPYNPSHVPTKHTAMGRFRHENVAMRYSPGKPVVAYMGDDKADSCVYKYVTFGAYDPTNREANLPLLEAGKLYAADFANGKWVRLDYDTQKGLQDAKKADGSPLFLNQADVVLDARAAALALRATPVDRPEDIEVHPQTGHVYIALTNNSNHGNFHGQIVRIIESDNNPESETFDWDFFAVGGPQSGFSSPDNLVFDPYGNLWMVTDISSSRVAKGIYKFQGNNAMFFFNTEGPNAGKAIQFASGPVESELTGPYWTPDGTTLFLYLHQIVRTRPWVKKREEELLTAFGEWLVAHPDLDAGLVSVTALLARHYAVDEGLDAPASDELEVALENFCGWAAYAGLIEEKKTS